MPYICLTRNDIPDGTVQILDLIPNTSQRIVYDPPGQTKYVNRLQNTVPLMDGATGLSLSESKGLTAYIADRVAIGGTTVATGTFTFAAVVNPGDTVSIKGVPFVNTGAAANPALQEFDASAGDNVAAATLTTAINDPATQALLLAALPLGVTVTAANTGAPSPLVTLTASVSGALGDAVTLASTGATILVSPMARAGATAWSAGDLDTVTTAIVARLDGGLSLTLADVDAILAGVGATFTTNGSTGVLMELLSILAGRGYTLPIGAQKFVGGVWNATIEGSFTHESLKFDTNWISGEFRPTTRTGDIVNVENKPVRHTYDSTTFQVSLAVGHLAAMANGVTLFPNSKEQDLSAPAAPYDQINNARLVTVYDNDGSLLA